MDQKAIAARNQEQALLNRLGQVPVFARLSSRHLQLLRKMARPRPLSPGDVVCEPGKASQGLCILLKGRLERRCDGVVLAAVTPIGTAGEIATLTGKAQDDEVVCTAAGVALHLPAEVMELVLTRDLDLYQRLARNTINWLSAELVAANESQAEVAQQRRDLERVIDEVDHDLNDARMLRSMRD